MALADPEPLIGIHLHQIDTPPYVDAPATDAEREYLEARAAWDAVERGYSSIQSTKPQTVAYGLNDSPAGLAAYVVEKWRSWSHDLERIDRDVLLTNLTIFWATQTIATSMRDYYDERWHDHRMGPHDRIEVPTAVALFANELVSEGTPPREWAERLFNIVRWTPMPRGGHFAPAEEPELLAATSPSSSARSPRRTWRRSRRRASALRAPTPAAGCNSVVGGRAIAIAIGAIADASLGVAAGVGGVAALVSIVALSPLTSTRLFEEGAGRTGRSSLRRTARAGPRAGRRPWW